MKKQLLLFLASFFAICQVQSQTTSYWTSSELSRGKIATDKGIARATFPKEFKLYDLNIELMRETLFSTRNNFLKSKTIISLPNTDGQMEEFEIFEASNFDNELQAKFPEIRAYSGIGITDKYATLKLSIAPNGIQTMVFRTDKENEFIEAYSQDHTIYAVFKSQRQKGGLPWTCSTDDKKMIQDINTQLSNTDKSSSGQLKTMRLAQSCNAEYSNYFGATNATQVALVLAAFNATLTRCNGVYEKDLALHLNLVASSTNVIYYAPASDPYTTLASWNTQLQKALNTTLTGVGTPLATNNAAYDIGHMFGASGGGGNAGCIGCPCVDGVTSGNGSTKGRGITSPADGIPQGDNFDIDYVVHEIGHQLGGNHTFSNSNEGMGVSKEVGSGVTIMGYAGITAEDVAPHSIDIYHETTIEQIQAVLAIKTCPVTTSLTGQNATPVANAGANYTIPKSTPFALTGSATDANLADALTYCWEQNDDGGANTGAASNATIAKNGGPNFISWSPSASPTRYFPKMTSIMANSAVTAHVGGDAGMQSEALCSVARTLNFRLTVRDNAPYIPLTKVAQTAFSDMIVTVNTTSTPFTVTSQNTAATTYIGGTTTTVTWTPGSTTTATYGSVANVDILITYNNGVTWSSILAATPNDGTQVVTLPNPATDETNCRIMVKADPAKNIFFNVNTTAFTITQALATENFDFQDFGLFPNPSKGDFTIKFTSASTSYVKINVHDMRGRQVYEKSFSNTGAFNQNINLNKVEAGIYLVTITDGTKKTVKRIVVE